MGPLLKEAMRFKFENDSRTLQEKAPDELKEDLERLDELDRELNPKNRRTFNGRDVALSLFGGGAATGLVYAGLSAAGAVFTLANPIAGLTVLATAVSGTYLSKLLTESSNKNQVFEEYEVKVVEPKLHVMRMLNHYDALTPEQEEEYERLSGQVKTLRQRETQFKKDLGQARGNIEELRQNKRSLEQRKQRIEQSKQTLEATNRNRLSRLHALVEKEKKRKRTEKELRTSLKEREQDLAKQRNEAEEFLARTRAGLEGKFKAKHEEELKRLQAEVDAQEMYRRKANSQFLQDKQNDIGNLKVQRNHLLRKLLASGGVITRGDVIESSLDPRIEEMEEKLRNFRKRLEREGLSPQSSSSVSPERSLAVSPVPEMKEEIDGDMERLQAEVEKLTEQLQEKERQMLEALMVAAQKENELKAELDKLRQLNEQLQKDLDKNKRLMEQLQQQGRDAGTDRDEATHLLDEEKRKLLKAQNDFDTRVQELETSLRELQEKKTRLVEEATHRDTELATTKEKVEEVNRGMDTLKEECQHDIEALKQDHVAALALWEDQVKRTVEQEWQLRVDESKEKLVEIEAKIEELKREAEASKKAYGDLQAKYTASEGNVTKVREIVETMLPPGAAATGQDLKTTLQQGLTQLKDEKEMLDEELNKLKTEHQQLQLSFEQLKQEKQEMLEGATDTDKELCQLREEVQNLGNELRQKTTEFERSVEESQQKHQEQLSQKQREFDVLQQQHKRLGLRDAALTVSYRLAVTAKKEAAETIRLRDEALQTAKEKFSQAQTQWDLAKTGFEGEITKAALSAKVLSKELEALKIAEQKLKDEVREKGDALKGFESQLQTKGLVPKQDREKLDQLEKDKNEAAAAVKKIETEKKELQLLHSKLETSKDELQESYDALKEERDDLLPKLKTADEGREAAEIQLKALQQEFDEARRQFNQEKEKVELAHKLQELEDQKKELEGLRREKDRLSKNAERQRKAYLRRYGEPGRPDQGDVRLVGDASSRLKVDLFEFQDITDKTEEFDGVTIPLSDMAGRNAKKQLTEELKAAQRKFKEVHDETHGDYEPGRDGMPTLSERRQKMQGALETYKKELIKCKEEFEKKKCDPEARKAILKNLQDTLEVAEAGIGKVKVEEEAFQDSCKSVDELMTDHEGMIGGNSSVTEIGKKTTTAFQSVSHKSQEVRDFACAQLVASMVAKFKASTPTERPDPHEIEKLELMRAELEEKKKVLRQFHPDSLPLDTGRTLSSRGKQYLDHTITTCTAELEEMSRSSDEVDEVFPVDPRNEGGMVLAKRMLAEPKICADVCSWFSSLQGSHARIKKSKDSFDYHAASVSGLETIRHDHQLVYMPTPFELLSVIKADLGEVDSKFTTESCRQHRGRSKDSNGEWRRKKLSDQCDIYLGNEESEGGRLRGQPQSVTVEATDLFSTPSPLASVSDSDFDCELVAHAHKDVLDCFAEANGCQDVHTLKHAKTDEIAFDVFPVKPDVKGLMNTFFDGCSGTPVLRVDKKTKEQLLSVDSQNAQPGPVVFKKTRQGWKVSLGGNNWWVDPSIVTANPRLQVPFEWKAGKASQLQRDWIPLRDAHGNTSVLMLRKSASMGDRYFMYQLGSGGLLIPKPIGTSNMARERLEAQLLYEAALMGHNAEQPKSSLDSLGSGDFGLQSLGANPMASLATQQARMKTSNADKDVLQITAMSRRWAKNADPDRLTSEYDETVRRSESISHLAPLEAQPLGDFLGEMEVPPNELRLITREKRLRQKSIQTYSQPRFSTFSVGAGFDTASQKYFGELKKKSSNGDSPVVDAQQSQCKEYRDGVFRELQVFKGCELDDGASPGSEGAPAVVEANFVKVIKQNTDHCLRMHQQVEKLRKRLVDKIRGAHTSELKNYTDQQLLDRAVMEFEKGNVVHGIYDGGETKNILLFVQWMQAENDLRLHSRMKRKLSALDDQLGGIKKDANVLAEEDSVEYLRRCQSWNLEMALLASEMQALQERLDSYQEKPLDAATRAIMSFERRAETVLRSGVGGGQVREVEEAMADITLAMKNDKTMARVSQLGTGWGKSTMVQLWTDLGCSYNVGHPERSVMVIAPTRNKLDLDRMLVRYYDQKGMEYHSLDLMKQYVNPAAARPNSKWWQEPALVEIHNILLGVPKDTAERDRAKMVQHMRAPVGASIQDVQILVHLRRQLQSLPNPNTEDRLTLRRLDGIADLFGESMIFADEWDSALVPPLPRELEEVTVNVNKALLPLENGASIQGEDVTHGHGTFIFGCKRKHLLSATTGTTYTAAVASGATKIDEVAQKCHTDPYTTGARVIHQLGMSEPIMIDSGQGKFKEQLYGKVVERVGTDRPVMLFNSDARGDNNFEQAVENFSCLSRARQNVAKKSGATLVGQKGMLYYDGDKKLCQYLPGDPRYDGNDGKAKDVPLTREDEELIRANGGNMVDVCLGQSESVGTDAPQCLDSAGVFVGLFEQPKNGRFDLSAQQMGRLTRATRSMHKPQQLFVVVDCNAIRKLDQSPERDEYLKSYKVLEEQKQKFASMFSEGMPLNVAKAVEAPMNVLPANHDGMEDTQGNIKRNLKFELECLEQDQWARLRLGDDQIQALRELKMAQWEAKVKYLELAAKELAGRDVNDHIKTCESTLERAAVDSAMERAYSEEDNWLKNLTCETRLLDPTRYSFSCEVSQGVPTDPKTEMPNPPHKLTEDLVRDAMVAEAGKKLASLSRRVVHSGLTKEGLAAGYDPSVAKAKIQTVFGDIKTKGLEFKMDSPVNEVHAELREYSLKALEDAQSRLSAILVATKRDHMKIIGSGHKHNEALLKPLEDRVANRIREVRDNNSFEHAMETEQFLQETYSQLLMSVNYLVISNQEAATTTQLIFQQVQDLVGASEYKIQAPVNSNKLLKDLIPDCISLLKGYRPPDEWKNVDSKAPAVCRLKWVPKKRSQLPKMVKMQAIEQTKSTPLKTKGKAAVKEPRMLDVVAFPDFDKNFKWKRSDDTGRPLTPGTFGNLTDICEKGRSARHTLNCWEMAKTFCDADNPDFEACVTDMEQAVLDEYEELQGAIKQNLHESAQNIQAQHQLMAAAA